MKIVDDHLQEVKEAGKAGEVLVRGAAVFSGYLGIEDSEQQDVFTDDGWFRTSDMGFLDNQGHLYVVCRK